MSDIDGVVEDVTAKCITIRGYDGEEVDITRCAPSCARNQATCIHQKPIVAKGQRVSAGEPIADGPSTNGGELALGHNMTVAFALWEGYNYEDAIILSRARFAAKIC